MTLMSSLITENLQQLFSTLFATLPRLAAGILIIILGFIAGRMAATAVQKVSKAVGMDKLGDKLNQIDIVNNSKVHINLGKLIGKIVYYFIVLIFIVAATDVMGIPALSKLFNDILNWLPHLLVALVILSVGLVFADFMRGVVYTACNSLGIPSSRLVSLLVFYFLFVNIAISALNQAKVDTDFISANISIIIGGAALAFAIGYGLASQNIMSNFLTSHYTKDKFQVGDKVKINGIEGVIIDIDRSNMVLSAENKKILIPLHKVSTETIEIFN